MQCDHENIATNQVRQLFTSALPVSGPATQKWRNYDVKTKSFRRHNYVIIASCARWAGLHGKA